MKIANYMPFVFDLMEHDIVYAAKRTAALGLDAVEFLDGFPGLMYKKILPEYLNPKETAEILAEYNLTTACYSIGAQMLYEDPDKMDEILHRHVEMAAALGSPYFHHTLVMGRPAGEPTYEEILDTVVQRAGKIAGYCEKAGITCIYEPQGFYFNGVEGLGRFFERMQQRHPGVGICGDIGNSFCVDVDPTAVFARFAKDIRHVHLRDFLVQETPLPDRQGYPTPGGKWLYDTEIGQGSVDYKTCMTHLKTAGFDGSFSLEICGDDDVIKRAAAFARNIYA